MGGVRQDEELVPAVVLKGQRSKRQRVHSPAVVLTAPAEWSSSAASATAPQEEDSSGTSPSTGGCVTEEEEDMARCLMLLSRGEPAAAKEVDHKGGEAAAVVVNKQARFRSRRPAADGAEAGEFVYECKTCNKCFPSFQALGGHRTSHKKPRLHPPPPSSEDKNNPAKLGTTTTAPPSQPPSPTSAPPPAAEETANAAALAIPVPAVPKQEPGTGAAAVATASSSRHPRVHECSICGAEFTSGQALGGHMRRHRPLVPAAARDRDDAPRKEKSLLELDLNMPAPCDEADASVTSPRFAFAVIAESQPPAPLLFRAAAASTLVDCHY